MLPNEVPVAPIVRKPTNGNPSNTKPATRLRQMLDQRADLEVSRLEAAEAKRMTTEVERETRRIEDSMSGNSHEARDEREPEADAKKANLVVLVETLRDAGYDNVSIGEILTGAKTRTNGTHTEPRDNTGDMLKMIKEVLHIANEVNGKKESPEITVFKDDLKEVKAELKALTKMGTGTVPVDPVKQAAAAAESIVTLYTAFDKVGLLPQGGEKQKSLEVLREENRHDERVEEIKSEGENRNKTAQLISGGISQVGRAAARALREGAAEGESQAAAESPPAEATGSISGDVIQLQCSRCKRPFSVSSDATSAKCPSCGTEFERSGSE